VKLKDLIAENLNEKRWDISQRTREGEDFRSAIATSAKDLQKTVAIYKNRHKVNPEEMKYHMDRWMKGLHKSLKQYGVLS
jgi:hypothetical protein